MKKIVTTTTNGGGPLSLTDHKTVFNDEVWDGIEALLSGYTSDTEGVIVSGCVVGGSGPSSYTISAGIVFLNGEFMRLPAQTGKSLPQYIQPDTPINTQRTFASAVLTTLFVEKSATVAGSTPGAGQYIAITTTTDGEDRRLALEVKGKWTTIALSAGWSGTIQYRTEKCGRVVLRGSIHATAPTATSTVTAAAAVPTPASDSKFVVAQNSGVSNNVSILKISSSGVLTIDLNFVTDSDYNFDGVSYFQ